MKTLAPTVWSPGDIRINPGGASPKKLQRIFPSRWSDWTKESSVADPEETLDQSLVLQSRNGDAAAFESLIRKHQRMIHSLTYRMTGSLDDADDLTQETFIRAYRQISSYRAASKFSTWLYRIALNACLNLRQRETLRVEVHKNWTDTNCAPQAAAESAQAGNDLGRRAHGALLKLPAKQRAAIMLTLYDGLNHAQAAEVLHCSEATVSWRVFAARRKLQRWLATGGEAE
jgi:RNA polymerase sigma-70 factor (ECF subfamily)